jgi:hypothetical protein
MRRIGTGLIVAISAGAWILPATAAPPTVTPSPGYDARLHEQHAQIAHESYERYPQPTMLHRKRHHGAAR